MCVYVRCAEGISTLARLLWGMGDGVWDGRGVKGFGGWKEVCGGMVIVGDMGWEGESVGVVVRLRMEEDG